MDSHECFIRVRSYVWVGVGNKNRTVNKLAYRSKIDPHVTCYLLPVSRNPHGRRGTTADIGDNLLPSLTVLGCSLTVIEVEIGPLFDVIFQSFLLSSPFSGTVPCRTFLQRPLDLVTCP